jgi:hypothetical protein
MAPMFQMQQIVLLLVRRLRRIHRRYSGFVDVTDWTLPTVAVLYNVSKWTMEKMLLRRRLKRFSKVVEKRYDLKGKR